MEARTPPPQFSNEPNTIIYLPIATSWHRNVPFREVSAPICEIHLPFWELVPPNWEANAPNWHTNPAKSSVDVPNWRIHGAFWDDDRANQDLNARLWLGAARCAATGAEKVAERLKQTFERICGTEFELRIDAQGEVHEVDADGHFRIIAAFG